MCPLALTLSIKKGEGWKEGFFGVHCSTLDKMEEMDLETHLCVISLETWILVEAKNVVHYIDVNNKKKKKTFFALQGFLLSLYKNIYNVSNL